MLLENRDDEKTVKLIRDFGFSKPPMLCIGPAFPPMPQRRSRGEAPRRAKGRRPAPDRGIEIADRIATSRSLEGGRARRGASGRRPRPPATAARSGGRPGPTPEPNTPGRTRTHPNPVENMAHAKLRSPRCLEAGSAFARASREPGPRPAGELRQRISAPPAAIRIPVPSAAMMKATPDGASPPFPRKRACSSATPRGSLPWWLRPTLSRKELEEWIPAFAGMTRSSSVIPLMSGNPCKTTSCRKFRVREGARRAGRFESSLPVVPARAGIHEEQEVMGSSRRTGIERRRRHPGPGDIRGGRS